MKDKQFLLKLTLLLLIFVFFAQASAGSWFGVRSGYPLNITAHFGFENVLFTGIGIRASANLSQRQAFLDYIDSKSGSTSFGFGADALLPIVKQNPVSIYLGVGSTVNFAASKTLTDIHGLAGLEYRPDIPILNQLGIFTEATAAIGAINLTEKSFQSLSWSLGVNWHLP